ncbi:hypothetical protein [Armatimonas sp.]|uniref:hypothetical protein n=1 Tax=Armatimonas sp. TaxID=1872638 RepID=UPI00286A3835|nr:hypothetical protein [Armatimonas sp.]
MRFVIPDLDDPMAHPKSVRRAVAQRRDAVFQEWRAHCDALRPTLSPDLVWLLEFSLDDALPRFLKIDQVNKTLTLGLLVGDLQRGYFETSLHYQGITLSPMETQILCLLVSDDNNEVAWGELDRAPSGTFTHCLRWRTRVETGRVPDVVTYFLDVDTIVRFTDFSLELKPREDRTLRPHKERIRIAPDPNFIEGLC